MLSSPANKLLPILGSLATSAFHLRGSDTEDSDLDFVARGFRAKAFAALQKTLQEPLDGGEAQTMLVPSASSTTHCEAVISAMLTLITMDVSRETPQ